MELKALVKSQRCANRLEQLKSQSLDLRKLITDVEKLTMVDIASKIALTPAGTEFVMGEIPHTGLHGYDLNVILIHLRSIMSDKGIICTTRCSINVVKKTVTFHSNTII